MVFFQQGGDFHIFFVDFCQIEAFDMDEAEQFAYGFGHLAAGFVALTSGLSNADLAPEVYLVHPGLFTDGFNIFYIFKYFHKTSFKFFWLRGKFRFALFS